MTQALGFLLPDVAAGNADAARRCVQEFGPLVWSIARRHSRSDADAEDAVQDIFVSLWKSAGRFDPERSSEAGFVAMIARRRLIDQARKHGRRDPATIPIDVDVAPDPSASVTGRTESARISESLAALRPEQRQVLWMSTVHGLSQEEIATKTGMPLGTVKAHARRGLLRLRELFFAASRTHHSPPPTTSSTREEFKR